MPSPSLHSHSPAPEAAPFVPTRDLPLVSSPRSGTCTPAAAARALASLRVGFGLASVVAPWEGRQGGADEDEEDEELQYGTVRDVGPPRAVRGSAWAFSPAGASTGAVGPFRDGGEHAHEAFHQDQDAEQQDDEEQEIEDDVDAASDAFEDRAARAWLHRLIAGRIALQEEEPRERGEGAAEGGSAPGEDGTGPKSQEKVPSADDVLEQAAQLLAACAGKAASRATALTYVFRGFGSAATTSTTASSSSSSSPSAGPAASAPSASSSSSSSAEPHALALTLHDGTLVDDALGARTWGAAPLLAWECLSRCAAQEQEHCARERGELREGGKGGEGSGRRSGDCAEEQLAHATRAHNILELGAGTGLVGLALASWYEARARASSRSSSAAPAPEADRPAYRLALTDHHPTVLANLRANARRWAALQERRWARARPAGVGEDAEHGAGAGDESPRTATAGTLAVAPLDWYAVYRARQQRRTGSEDDEEEHEQERDYTSRDSSAQTLPPERARRPGASASACAAGEGGDHAAASASADGAGADADGDDDAEAAAQLAALRGRVDTLIVADCVYDTAHPRWIRAVAEEYLARPGAPPSPSPSSSPSPSPSPSSAPWPQAPPPPPQQLALPPPPAMHILSPLRATHAAEIDALRAAFPRARAVPDATGAADSPGAPEAPEAPGAAAAGAPPSDNAAGARRWRLRTVAERTLVGYDDFAGVQWRAARFRGGYNGASASASTRPDGTQTLYLYLEVQWVFE